MYKGGEDNVHCNNGRDILHYYMNNVLLDRGSYNVWAHLGPK